MQQFWNVHNYQSDAGKPTVIFDTDLVGEPIVSRWSFGKLQPDYCPPATAGVAGPLLPDFAMQLQHILRR